MVALLDVSTGCKDDDDEANDNLTTKVLGEGQKGVINTPIAPFYIVNGAAFGQGLLTIC